MPKNGPTIGRPMRHVADEEARKQMLRDHERALADDAARGTRPRQPKGPPMSERKERFVDIVSRDKGVGLAKAATLAGFSTSPNEVERLLADPEVCARIIRKIQPRLARFERMTMRAWDALDYNLDPRNWELVDVGKGKMAYPVTGADRVASAALVFKVLASIDPDLLALRARAADTRGALRDLVAGILSETTQIQEGIAAPEGPPAEGAPVIDVDDLALAPEPDAL